MAVESEEFTELGDEFGLVAETAAEAGAAGDPLPKARRGWVNVPPGGHVSGVFWGDGPPEVVFLHGIGESARAWDAVALVLGRPSVAIDRPGHGHGPTGAVTGVTSPFADYGWRERMACR
jgi:pimeloyl-ACP methyl ester carboxylesterase